MKKYSVRLSFQCSENWHEMTPEAKGRHCLSCNKTVIDFSVMKDEEIVKYLLANKNTCGRFQSHQLGRPMFISSYKPKSNWPTIAAMLIAGLVSVIPTSLNASNTVHGNIAPGMEIVTTVHGGTTLYEPTTETPGLIRFGNNKLVVEPDSAKSYYIIHLFDNATKLNVYNGVITIENLGNFSANSNGDIVLENIYDKLFLSNTLQITVSAPGYGTQVFNLDKKNLKNSTNANLYLHQMEMKSGMIEIDEIKTSEK